MLMCMRTTLELSSSIRQKLINYSRENNLSMKTVIEKALLLLFDNKGASKNNFKLKNKSFKGEGLMPEFVGAGWEKLREEIYK